MARLRFDTVCDQRENSEPRSRRPENNPWPPSRFPRKSLFRRIGLNSKRAYRRRDLTAEKNANHVTMAHVLGKRQSVSFHLYFSIYSRYSIKKDRHLSIKPVKVIIRGFTPMIPGEQLPRVIILKLFRLYESSNSKPFTTNRGYPK